MQVALEKDSPPPAARPPQRSINATAPKRFLTLAAIKLLKRFRERHGSVLFLTSNLCVKYGRGFTPSEATTMQFLAAHTSLPVPRVHCAFEHRGRTYIVMQRLHGEVVGRGWVKRSEESKKRILDQLKSMVDEMRAMQPPEGTAIGNIEGGPLQDPRMAGTSSFGPFATVEEFHKHLRGGVEADPRHIPEISALIAQQDASDTALAFTHGDLSSLNVLASGDEVVGIIDWETAGWYPAYWEYTSAWHVNPQNQFWRDEVDKFLEPMPKELEMEKLRLKYFGDV